MALYALEDMPRDDVGVEWVEERAGAFWLAGTRVSLDSVVYASWNGHTAEEIGRSFPVLTLEQVYGAVAFYIRHRDEIDRYLAYRAIEFEAARDRARASDQAFYAKLDALRGSRRLARPEG
jgi:uncharacterized protein (DUF433 family)